MLYFLIFCFFCSCVFGTCSCPEDFLLRSGGDPEIPRRRSQVVRFFGSLPRAPGCILSIVYAYWDLDPILVFC